MNIFGGAEVAKPAGPDPVFAGKLRQSRVREDELCINVVIVAIDFHRIGLSSTIGF